MGASFASAPIKRFDTQKIKIEFSSDSQTNSSVAVKIEANFIKEH